jgi:hypothetical protein
MSPEPEPMPDDAEDFAEFDEERHSPEGEFCVGWPMTNPTHPPHRYTDWRYGASGDQGWRAPAHCPEGMLNLVS